MRKILVISSCNKIGTEELGKCLDDTSETNWLVGWLYYGLTPL